MHLSVGRALVGVAFLACLAIECAPVASPAQAGEPASATKAATCFAQNQRLGRGVNIIGYDPLWRSRDRARFQERHFAMIREAGFTSVRINLHPWRDRRIDAQHQLEAGWLETLDWAVAAARKQKLAVILDLHEFQAMGKDPQGNRERFLVTWRQLAQRYAKADGDVFFEILNEPNEKLTPALWNEFAAEALAIIRKTNPTRCVIIGPGRWNNIDALAQLELPADDRNLIVTVHYYNPFPFTHQGTPWTGQKDKVGVPWNGTAKEREAVQRDFAKVQAWAEKHRRPIYVGEFGAYEKADMASKARYLSCVTREAEKLGWSWGYWQFDGDFIVFDMKTQRWVQPILDALIPPRD